MAKNNRKQENSFAVNLAEGQKWVLRDEEHKSKAFVPLQIDAGNSVEVVRVDGGLIAKQPTSEEICDNLVYTVKDARMGGITPPYDILCYDHNDSYIAYPSMLMKLLEKKEKGQFL